MLKLHLGILFGVSFICCRCSICNDSEPPKSELVPPINQLANVLRFFNTTELCNHNCDASSWYDDYGSLNICFKTELKRDENADDLCRCMYNYINENNWLDDSDYQCTAECNTLSMVLIGPPNPDYDSNAVITRPDKPLATLVQVLKKFSSADLGGHNCKSISNVKNDGLTHLSIKCKLTCQSPSPKQVCEDVLQYLNQNHLLDNTKSKCSSKKNCVCLGIVGN